MYNVNDFKFLVDIVEDVANNLCNSVKGPGMMVRLVLECAWSPDQLIPELQRQ